MRVLFVDDEQLVLDGIQRSLFDSDWEVETANSGQEALEMFADEGFDIIVSDMRMPGMDGAELLGKIEALYPDTIRIILSGQADQAVALRSSFVSHRWLDKPFDPDEMQNVLSLLENALDAMPSPEMRKLICGISSLPSPPKTYARIQTLIQQKADMEEVANVIDEDAALATKVLQVTNSALFSRGGETTDVQKAVVRLGADMVSEFVLFAETYAMASTSPLLNVDKVTKESFMISRLAAVIAEHIDESMVSEAKLAGLLSDIGQGALLQGFPDIAQQYLDRTAYSTEAETEQIETEMFGVTDAQIGAYLLLMWGFSTDIFNAVLISRKADRCLACKSILPVIIFTARQLASGRDVQEDMLQKLNAADQAANWKEQAERLRARD